MNPNSSSEGKRLDAIGELRVALPRLRRIAGRRAVYLSYALQHDETPPLTHRPHSELYVAGLAVEDAYLSPSGIDTTAAAILNRQRAQPPEDDMIKTEDGLRMVNRQEAVHLGNRWDLRMYHHRAATLVSPVDGRFDYAVLTSAPSANHRWFAKYYVNEFDRAVMLAASGKHLGSIGRLPIVPSVD